MTRSGVVGAVATARRLERPAWINARTVFGLALFVVSFGAAGRVLEMQKTTIDVWAASSDVAEGEKLSTADLRPVPVKLPSELLDGYVLAERDIAGATATRSIAAGELIPVTWLAEGAVGAGRTVTVPIESGHAVGGLLRAGDRVDVLATFEARLSARTLVLIQRANVVGVVVDEGMMIDERSIRAVTLSVSAEDATRLVFALRTADIDVVRVDSTSSPVDAEITAEDLR